MNPLRYLRHKLTYIPRKKRMTPVARGLKQPYDVLTVSADEALLIAHFAGDQADARRLLAEHPNNTAAEIVRLYPLKKPAPKLWKRFRAWLDGLEGTDSLARVARQLNSPDHRRGSWD